MSNPYWWLLVLFAPLVGALVQWRWPQKVSSWLWLACVPALLASFWPPEPLALATLWPGAEWAGDELSSRVWLGFTALLWGCATRYEVRDLMEDRWRERFWLCWVLALTGSLMLILARDAAGFYVGFTMMSLSAYGLIVHAGGKEPHRAARIYLVLAMVGEMLVLAGLVMRVYEAGGSLAVTDLQNAPVGATTAALLLVGFGLKAGFWPLHVWLPIAHPVAPAAASAVLSGAMIKAGVLGIWRFLPVDDPLMQSWSGPLLVVGFTSIFYGALVGVLQNHAKKVLAYSSVSQMGFLMVIIALAWQQPESRQTGIMVLALYAAHHAFAKGALFMGAGLAAHYSLRPYHWVILALPALALAGLPLTSGASAKLLMKSSFEAQLQDWLLPLLSAGATVTLLLVCRALWLMYRHQDESPPQRPVPGQTAPLAVLCIMSLALPWLMTPWRDYGLQSVQDLEYAWQLVWPLVVGFAAAAAVILSGLRLSMVLDRLHGPAKLFSVAWHRFADPAYAFSRPRIVNAWRYLERKYNRAFRVRTVQASAWLIAILVLLSWVVLI